jgi:O-antigen ligase
MSLAGQRLTGPQPWLRLPVPVSGVRPRATPVTVLASYAALLTLIPAQLTFAPMGAVGTPAGILGYLALLLWAGGRALRGARHVPAAGPQPVRLVIALLLTSALASYASANTRVLSVLEQGGADRALLVLLGYCGIALLAADGLDRMRLDRLLSVLVVLGSVVAGVGILQFTTGVDIARFYSVLPGLTENTDFTTVAQRSIFRRVNGTTSHPIEFSVMLCMLLPIALHKAFSSGRKHRPRQWVPPILIASAIPMTLSRSGTLALGVVALVLAFGWRREQLFRALLFAPLFIVMMRLLVPGLLGTIRSLFTNISNDPSISGRTDDYAAVREYISAGAWIGRGLGTFNPVEYQVLDNQYLGQLIETGVVGLAALLALFLVGIGLARGARLRAADAVTRDLGQALAAALCVPAFSFATFDGFAFPIISGLTFLVLGCAGALWRTTGGLSRELSWARRLLVPPGGDVERPAAAIDRRAESARIGSAGPSTPPTRGRPRWTSSRS